MSFEVSQEAQRAFVDSLEENCSRIMTLKREEIRAFIARMCDALSISPSTIVPDFHQKVLAAGLGQREASVAMGIMIAASMSQELVDSLLSIDGIETVKEEAEHYVEYIKL